MTAPAAPAVRPANPNFSSGPCAKRPGWSLEALRDAALGRSHRAKIGKAKLKQAIDLTREVLEVPADYRIGIVPASDTGAVEMALWSLLGPRPVDVLAWESFGLGWVTDVVKQLKLKDARTIKADYGKLPDLAQVDFDHDVVFTWNGTTSGVRVPNGDVDRRRPQGPDHLRRDLGRLCPGSRLRQARCRHLLLAEGARRRGGARRHHPQPARGRAARDLHAGVAAAQDLPHDQGRQAHRGHLRRRDHQHAVDAVRRGLSRHAQLGKGVGGLKGLMGRADANFKVLADWAAKTPWIDFFAEDPAARSNTSVTLKIVDPDVTKLEPHAQEAFLKAISARLDKENVAHDINYHRDAPPHFRIWAGATIEASDLEVLTQWLDWAFAVEKASLKEAA